MSHFAADCVENLSPWDPCHGTTSTNCKQTRTTTVIAAPKNGGKACETVFEKPCAGWGTCPGWPSTFLLDPRFPNVYIF